MSNDVERKLKEIRANIQSIVDELAVPSEGEPTREKGFAIKALQEGKMWLGHELGNVGSEDLNATRDAKELGDGEDKPDSDGDDA